MKTEERGWLLFDDEMVEPVDKSYVQNFFGDRPGLACAYVLFYQETTQEAVKREQDAESLAAAAKAVIEVPKEPVGLGLKTNGFMNGIQHVKSAVTPTSDEDTNGFASLDKAVTEPPPPIKTITSPSEVTALPPILSGTVNEDTKAKKERKAVAKITAKQEEKAERERIKSLEVKRKEALKKADLDTRAAIQASKASKAEEDQRETVENANQDGASAPIPVPTGGLSRFKTSSKSFRKPKLFGGSRESTRDDPVTEENGVEATTPTDKSRNRFSSLRKKTSNMML